MPSVTHGSERDSLVATHATELATSHSHLSVKSGLAATHNTDQPQTPYTAPVSGTDEKRGAFNQKEFFTKADWREEAARLFQTLDVSGNGQVLKEDLFDHVRATGIRLDDRRLHGFVATLKRQPGDTVNFNTFLKATMPERLLIDSIMKNQLVIPNWKEFTEDMGSLYEDCKQFREGEISKYIPQLARQDPELWGVALCTVDGQRAGWGDVNVPYSAQSTAKPVTYCMARELYDEESVHAHVGREPSGRDFNELVLNRHGRPHNPLINAGAIMTSALIHTKQPLDYRLEQLLLMWQHLCGAASMPLIDDETYQSELSVGHRNRALGYLMAERDAFPEGSDLDAALTLYFKQCSIRMTAEQQAVLAATLAAGGVCPITGRRVLQPETVQACLSMMLTCGMLDYSGKYCYRIGLPAKSGICGAVMIIVPGVMGIVTFSPRVDRMGNSVRGVKFSKELVQRFKFHQFDIVNTGSGSTKKDPTTQSGDEGTVVSMLYAAADGELDVVRYLANEGIDLSQADYDSRTALHLAAAENHYNVAFFLLTQGATGSARDRWGTTPLDEARHVLAKNPGVGSNMVELLQQAENGDLPLYDPPHGQEVSSFEDYDENERESFRNSVQTWKLPILRNTQGKYVYVPRDQWNAEAFIAPNGSRPLDRERKGVVTVEEFSALCAQQGIRPNDRRLNGIYGLLLEKGSLSVNTFLEESLPARTLLKSMISGLLVVPEWKKFASDVRGLFESVRNRKEGENAHYIPPLRDADPEKWGLAICTVDGQQATMGDSKIKYTAQSTSKPLTYCLARQLHGEEKTHQHVGHEPSGRLFNEVVLNKRGRPHNPCINAGAIMCASLIETTRSVNHRMATLLEMWRRVMGEEVAPGYSEEVYQGETSTANRNRCLTYFMAEMNAFPEGNDLEASLSLYFKACSIEVNVEQHAVAAATLASGGICPITGERVFDATTVQNCLSLMQTCGMYDYSGEFCYRIGLPAKSGVAGAVMVVIPNVMGIVTFSPRLDEMGNSVRGVAFCEALVSRFAFHQYIVGTAGRADPTNKKQSDDSATAALWAARRGDLKALQALGANGTDLSQADYDGRTPLHLAAAEGHAECAYYISNRNCVNINAVDRFGNTAIDEARRIGADRCVEVLQQAISAQQVGRSAGRAF